MKKKIAESVQTKCIGFAPVLRHYFEKCRIAEIIDGQIATDSRRRILSHGEACIAMITAILYRVLQLYRLCKFARETTVLEAILPAIKPEEYFDDRLADTLDALYEYGTGNVEMLITRHMINEFGIVNEECHNDTTSSSFYGDCNNNMTDSSINITFGFSKKKRHDLKQLVWSLSVSSDSGFPLFQQAYSGNTADVETYVEQWHNLIDLLGNREFLYVADSKLVTRENMTQINDNEGFFVAPVPMYESYKTQFTSALNSHDSELLIPYKNQLNRGFEAPLSFEYEGRVYNFRMIILFDHGFFSRKSSALKNRADLTRKAFQELDSRLNAYRLKTFDAIDRACSNILEKNNTTEFFTCKISNNPETVIKNKSRGRTPKNREPEKIEEQIDRFSVELFFDGKAFEDAICRCGYYPLVTNTPADAFSVSDLMMAYKNQYKNEHINRRAKSRLDLEPVYLHTPERIEAFLFLFKTALQIIVLIERSARKNIEARDKGLDDFMPNRKDVRNPGAEYMLAEFDYIVSGEMTLPDGMRYGFVSELNALQKDILSILDVPESCFSYEYLFGSG